MNFVNPAYLWGLVGLVIPIAIHLWSKREGKIIKVGSIQNFPISESKKSRSLRLNEIALLLLRSVLISLLVFALAELQWHNESVKPPLVLLEPEVLRNSDYVQLLDSLRSSEVEMRVFSQGFPVVKDSSDRSVTMIKMDYWDLMQNIDQLNTDSVTVYSNSRLSNFLGDRAQLSTVVNWMTVPIKEEEGYIVDAYATVSGMVKCIVVYPSGELTKTERINLEYLPQAKTRRAAEGKQVKLSSQKDWVTIRELKKTNVTIWYDVEFRVDVQYIEAATKACAGYLDVEIEISSKQTKEFAQKDLGEVNIWLSEKQPTSKESMTLQYVQDDFTESLIRWGGDTYHLTRRLNRKNIFEGDLATSLFPLFYDVKGVTKRMDSIDNRIMASSQIKPILKSGSPDRIRIARTMPLLWILVAILLVAERVTAHLRKQ